MNNEIWKDIKGFEGLYQVSNLGNVKSLEFNNRTTNHQKREKLLKSFGNKLGYQRVVLYKNKTKKQILVHRLVAEVFIPNPNNLPQVNHKDENPANNCIDNLEWCSHKYNCNYGNFKEKVSKGIKKSVIQFTKDFQYLRTWEGMIDVERQLGISCSLISMCCKGKLKTAGGYRWQYQQEYELLKEVL